MVDKNKLEKHRKDQELLAAQKGQAAADRQKFMSSTVVKASEARKVAEAEGAPTLEAQADVALSKIMTLVKSAAIDGRCYVQVPAGHMVHPDVKAMVIKKLDAGGFKHELDAGVGYIYF